MRWQFRGSTLCYVASKAPVSRDADNTYRKTDKMIRPLTDLLLEIDAAAWRVSTSATDYPADWNIAPHSHNKHQLIYAIQGVMVVHAAMHQWTVPPSRGIWMPCGQEHAIRCIGPLKMRSVFVHPDDTPDLPTETRAVSISPLLSELIQTSIGIAEPYPNNSREARVMNLILDELKMLPTLPLHLPQPADPRIASICQSLQQTPGNNATLADRSARLHLDEKTIQRLFQKGTGMTFGQWRQQARLMQALERIAVGEKIIEVAGALGYESPSAFATMFKKQFGVTPSQFFK